MILIKRRRRSRSWQVKISVRINKNGNANNHLLPLIPLPLSLSLHFLSLHFLSHCCQIADLSRTVEPEETSAPESSRRYASNRFYYFFISQVSKATITIPLRSVHSVIRTHQTPIQINWECTRCDYLLRSAFSQSHTRNASRSKSFWFHQFLVPARSGGFFCVHCSIWIVIDFHDFIVFSLIFLGYSWIELELCLDVTLDSVFGTMTVFINLA